MRTIRIIGVALAGAGLIVLALSASFAAADSGVSIRESNGRYAYTPKSITVAVGDSVTWTNDSDAPHTVDADNRSFESKTFGQHKAYSHTFTTAGTFAYHCDIHSYMKGTVTVLAAGITPPATDTDPIAPSGGPSSMWLVLVAAGSVLVGTALVLSRRARRSAG